MRRSLTYLLCFLAGFAIWLGFGALEVVHPSLAWRYPPLILLMGLRFPGGHPGFAIAFAMHLAETWLPFLCAYLLARWMTLARARAMGALALYCAFALWSALLYLGIVLGVVTPGAAAAIGLAVTLLGGLALYLAWVDPKGAVQ